MSSEIKFELLNRATYNKYSSKLMEIDEYLSSIKWNKIFDESKDFGNNFLSENKNNLFINFKLSRSEKVIYKYVVNGFELNEYLDSYQLNFSSFDSEAGSLFYKSIDDTKLWIDNESKYLEDEKDINYELIFSYGTLRDKIGMNPKWEVLEIEYFDVSENSVVKTTLNDFPSDISLIQNTSEFFLKVIIPVSKLRNMKWIKFGKNTHNNNDNLGELIVNRSVLGSSSKHTFLRVDSLENSTFEKTIISNHFRTRGKISLEFRKMLFDTFLVVKDKTNNKVIYNDNPNNSKNTKKFIELENEGWYEIKMYNWVSNGSAIHSNEINVHIRRDFSEFLKISTNGKVERYLNKSKNSFRNIFFMNDSFAIQKLKQFDREVKKVKIIYLKDDKQKHKTKSYVFKNIDEFIKLHKGEGYYNIKLTLFSNDVHELHIYLNKDIDSIYSFFRYLQRNYETNIGYLNEFIPYEMIHPGNEEEKLLTAKNLGTYKGLPQYLVNPIREKIYSLINLESLTFSKFDINLAQYIKKWNNSKILDMNGKELELAIKQAIYKSIYDETNINANIDLEFSTDIDHSKTIESSDIININVKAIDLGDLISHKDFKFKVSSISSKIKSLK